MRAGFADRLLDVAFKFAKVISVLLAMLLVLAFLAGIGGGAFSGFMPSTSYFFPKRMQGTALGLQVQFTLQEGELQAALGPIPAL